MSTASLPEDPALPDDALYEIEYGQIVEQPPMSAGSTWIASRLQERLGPFAEDHNLGMVVTEMLFILDRDLDLRKRPDVAFVSAERWPLDQTPPMKGDWDVVPDLAVEVVSPNDIFDQIMEKVEVYFDHGVRQVWLVSPSEQRVHAYDSRNVVRIVPVAEDLESSLLPGWRLPLAKLFRAKVQ
jgi:Uma2 family endonuclease